MLKNRYGNQVEIDLSMPEPIQQFESEEQDENNDTMNDANNQQLDSGDMLRIVTWRVFFFVFFFFYLFPFSVRIVLSLSVNEHYTLARRLAKKKTKGRVHSFFSERWQQCTARVFLFKKRLKRNLHYSYLCEDDRLD